MKRESTPLLKCLFNSYDILEKTGLIACMSDTYKVYWKSDIENWRNHSQSERVECAQEMSESVHDLLAFMCERLQVEDITEADNLYKTDLSLRGGFLNDAHKTIMVLGLNKIIGEQPEIAKKYIGVMLEDTYLYNKDLEQTSFTLSLGGKIRSENQVYAVASFYAVELALRSFQEDDLISLSKLQSDLYKFSKGLSYSSVHGSKGGNEKAKKMTSHKRRAEEIYKENNLHKYKNIAAAHDICNILKEENIIVSPKTVENNWVPAFKKKAKSLIYLNTK